MAISNSFRQSHTQSHTHTHTKTSGHSHAVFRAIFHLDTTFSSSFSTTCMHFLSLSLCLSLSVSLSLSLSLSVRALRTKRPSLPEERLHSAPRWTRRGQESPHQSAASGQHQAAPSNDHRHRFAKTYCCCSPAAFPSFPLYSSSFSSSLTAFAQAEALPKFYCTSERCVGRWLVVGFPAMQIERKMVW